MKTSQIKKRRQLVATRPGPLVLEARIMFDGAGADAVLMASHVAEPVEQSVAAEIMPAAGPAAPGPVEENADSSAIPGDTGLFDAASSQSGLQDAAARAQEIIHDFLDSHPNDLSLFEFFNGQQGAPSDEWLESARALRQDILEGGFTVRVREIGNAEIGGVFGAFAANGPDGQATIFVNRDWLAGEPSADAVNRVLIEEFGHALDHALNGEIDTLGDEGEAFAAAVLGLELSAAERMRIASENDHSVIYVDGQAYAVEQAAVTFLGLYEGTPSAWSQEANQINNVARIEGSGFKLTSADPGAPYFSGNNISGTLSYIDGNGEATSIDGVVSRLFKSNGVVHGFYFYVWGDTIEIGDGGPGGDAAEKAYLLVYDPTMFSVGGSYRTSSDPVDTALNKLIVPNSAPVAINDAATVAENGTVSGNVLANDTDANNDALTVTGFTVGTTAGTLGSMQTISGVGTFRLDSDGSFTFTAASGYTGPAPIVTYTVSDGQASSPGSLSITIAPVNDAPAGASKTVTVIEDSSYTFAVSDFGFSDSSDTPANHLHSVTITTLPADGSLSLDSSAVTAGQEILAADLARLIYTPDQDGNGNGYASFTFKVRDNGGTDNGGVDTDPTPKTITFNVTPVNDAPVANPDTAIAVEAGGVNNGAAGTDPTGNLLDNDSDPDGGDTIVVAAVASGVQGATVVGSDTVVVGVHGALTVSADGSYSFAVTNSSAAVQALRLSSDTLTDTFTYTVSDAAGLASSSALTVTIQGANDAPVANNDFNLAVHSATTPAARVNPSGNLLTNDTDVDAGDSKTVTQASAGQTLSGSPTDIGLGTLVEGVEGRTYLSFQTQGAGNLQVGAAVTGAGVPAGTTVSSVVNVSGTRTVTLSSHAALDGVMALTVGGNSYSVTALGAADANVIAISSVTGGVITTGMTVAGAGIQAGTVVSAVSSAGGFSIVTLSKSVSGALGADVLFGSSGTSIVGDHGTLVLGQDGSYTYTVTGSPVGTVYDHFTYRMVDAAGAASDAVLKIEINVSNSTPPTAAADANSITENTASISSDGATNVLNNDSGAAKVVTYAWAANDSAMTSVTSGGVDLVGLYGTISIREDGSYAYTLDNGNPAVDALSSGQSLADQFRYRMTDSGGGVAISTLTITIDGANDGPAGVNDAATAIEAGGVDNASAGHNPTGNVLANDTDVEGDIQSVSAIAGGTVGQAMAGNYGSLLLDANGIYTYTVDNGNATVQALKPGQSLADTFNYTVSDGNGGTASATLTITIDGANDAPVNTLPGASPSVAEGESVAITGLSVGDHDDTDLTVQLSVQNGALTIAALSGASVSGGSNGSSTLTLSGTKAQINSALDTLSYQGEADFSGTDTLTVTTTDSGGLADVDTLGIAVTPDDRALTVSGTAVNEASQYAFFSVDGVAGQKVSLALDTTGAGSGHAASGLDFAPGLEYYDGASWTTYTGGLVTIPAGGTMLVRVAILNDAIYEGMESFKLAAANKSGTSFEANSTIMDDGTGDIYLASNTSGVANTPADAGYPAYLDDDRSLSVNNITVNEASPYAVFTISGHSGQVVALSLLSGSATVGIDTGTGLEYYDGAAWQAYDGASVTLTGATLLVRATIEQDAIYEGAETFGLQATNLGGGSPALGIATINDDGAGMIFGGTVTGDIPDTSTSGLDDDRMLSVSSPIVNEASDYAIFTVTGNTGEQVSLALSNDSAGGTIAGKANIDAGQTIQFWNGAQWEDYDSDYLPAIQSGGALLVRVSIVQEQDSTYEGAETFQLSATYSSGDRSRSAAGTASIVDDGAGFTYSGAIADGAPAASASGLDDDRVLSVTSPAVNEASDYAVFTITGTPGLTAALQLVETAGSGHADIDEAQTLHVWDGSDWVAYGGSVTFSESGMAHVRVDITQEQDATFEGPESFQLRVNYTSGDTTRSATGTCTIYDDGAGVMYPGTFTGGAPDTGSTGLDDDRELSVSSPVVNEGSDYAVVAVTGNAGESVSLHLIETAGDGYADIDELQTLEFWNGSAWTAYSGSVAIPQNGVLYVRADIVQEQDSIHEGAETFQIRATTVSGATVHATGIVTIVDDGSGVRYSGAFTDGAPDASTADLDDDRPPTSLATTPDTASATEAGGVANAAAGTDPTGNVLSNDTGAGISVVKAQSGGAVDGDAASVAASSTSASGGATLVGAYGTLVIGADGSYVYTVDNGNASVQALNSGDALTDTFSYQVEDSASQIADNTLTVTINGANDAPLASAMTGQSGTVGAAIAPIVVPAFTDVDDASLSYAATLADGGALPAWLTFDASTHSFSGTPPAGASGSYSIRVTGSDGSASDSVTFGLTVNNPAAPVAAADAASATEAGGAANATAGTDPTGNVLSNDSGAGISVVKAQSGNAVDGNAVSVAASSTSASGGATLTGAYGTLVIGADGSYVYTIDNGHASVQALNSGDMLTDTFSYQVEDSASQTADNTLTVTINGANDAPLASAMTGQSGTVGAAIAPIMAPVFTDVDDASLSYAATLADGGALPAWLTFDASTHSFSGTPPAGASGSYSIRVTGSDDSLSDSVTFGLTVNNPAAPVAAADAASATEAGGAGNATAGTDPTGNVLSNDSGAGISVVKAQSGGAVGGDAASVAASSTSASGGAAPVGAYGTLVIGANGSYVYTVDNGNAQVQALNAGDALTDTFSYQVEDSASQTADNTLTVTINGANDAPLASAMTGQSGVVGAAMAPIVVPVFTDVDDASLSYAATLADGGALPAWLAFDASTRSFSGTPPAGAGGSYSIRVTGSDGTLSDSVTFGFTVANPDAPAQTVSIVSMTRDTGALDTDFLTADGGADRTVSGTISAPLGDNEVVQGSFDGGATWLDATSNGTDWTINDGDTHGSDWTIKARVVNVAAQLTGATATQDVVLDTSAPGAPTVDALVTASTTPTLSGHATLGDGETLTVTVNGSVYVVTPAGGVWTLDLSSAQPESGTLTPLVQGRSYDVTARITDAAGNASNDSTSNELAIAEPPPPAPLPPPPAPTPLAPAPVPPPSAPVPPVAVQPAPFVPIDVHSPGVGQGMTGNSGLGARPIDMAPEHAIRSNAGMSDVYTRSEGFRTVVSRADEPALVVFRGVPDQYTESGNRLSLTIPADAFVHTQPKEVVRLSATLQDGRPLPTWVQFNAQTGQFTGEVPEGLVGELRIKVTARDMEGREATALFRVNVGKFGDKGIRINEAPGKAGLSEQMKQQGLAGRNADRLTNPARAAPLAPEPRPL